MFHLLLSNTLVSAVAFLIVGIVGLLLVPVLVAAYGMVGFGLIMLARLFIPSGGLGLLDFGISEITTQVVAMGRVDGNWGRVRRRLALLVLATLVVSFPAALLLGVFAPQLAAAFSVHDPQMVSFIEVLRCTSLLLPLMFLALVIEGCIKGFDSFHELRLAEVLSTFVYAGSATIFALSGFDFKWIVYSHLASLVLRMGMIVLCLRNKAPAGIGLDIHFLSEDLDHIRERSKLFFTARLLGTMLHQMPTLLIGFLVGPVGVGLYDTISRLPRFAKSALGVLNTGLLPFVTRLEAAGDDTRIKLLLDFCVTLLPAIIFPPLAVLAAMSNDLLSLWISPDFAVNAPWLALFWVLPAINTLVSFQNYVLISRSSYINESNRLMIVQLVLQLIISLALLSQLSQFAFVVGYVASTLAIFAFQLSLGHKESGLPWTHTKRLVTFGVILTLACAAVNFVNVSVWQAGWIAFACVAIVAWIVLAGLTYAFFLSAEGRSNLALLFKMLAGKNILYIKS